MVDAIGEGVDAFAVGDSVVSTFFPDWLTGPAEVGDFKTVPGDGVDGYARELVVCPQTCFTHAPRVQSCSGGDADHGRLDRLARLVVEGGLKAGDTVLVLGTGGVSIFALQFAKPWGHRHRHLLIGRQAGTARISGRRSHHQLPHMPRVGKPGEGAHRRTRRGPHHRGRRPRHPRPVHRAVRIGGHISLIGVLTGRGGDVPTAKLMAKQARLQGVIVAAGPTSRT